jgi:ribonucleoside-diphosphate reductase alpha chain
MSAFAHSIYKNKYSYDGLEEWPDTAKRVTKHVLGALGYGPDSIEFQEVERLITERKFMPGGRYLYASGRGLHQTQNCLLMRAKDSREGWAELLHNSAMALMTGAGIGVDYSDVRPEGSEIKKTGGKATGPIALMQMLNECGRGIMQGGNRRSAIWAGLNWKHPDVFKFIEIKDWDAETVEKKAEAAKNGTDHAAPMDMTNISVLLDDEFFEAYWDQTHPDFTLARKVYSLAGSHMLRHAEPGFSVDVGDNAGETLRNACTEVTSRDDSDVCNLGSLNMAAFATLEEFQEAVPYATLFLLAGTVYSDLPYGRVYETREKNRRLGLGVMGVHEWLLARGKPYAADDELAQWLDAYATSTEHAHRLAELHGLSAPIKTRAIAPTGTIGIIAETTTGIEPVFAVSYKRRYLTDGNTWKFQYVIDPTAERIIQQYGIDPRDIEDAYTLSYNIEKRVAFQAWVQKWVDHGISSTVNLPYPVTDTQERDAYLSMLVKHLPDLRGITVYPDGARGGQPLTVVDYYEAKKHEGVVFEESEERCVGGACGI